MFVQMHFQFFYVAQSVIMPVVVVVTVGEGLTLFVCTAQACMRSDYKVIANTSRNFHIIPEISPRY